MIKEAKIIVERLDISIVQAVSCSNICDKDDARRYALSFASLIAHERDKILAMVRSEDNVGIQWALRSVSVMTKGLIDIGSDWREKRPDEWGYMMDTTSQAHNIELQSRR